MGNNNKKNNFILISIFGVIVVVIITFILFDNKSDTVSSIKSNSISNNSTKVSADNKQTSPINDGKGPSIQFPEPSYDFGTISQGDKVSHTFIVRNAGNEPLKLIKAKGS